MFSFHGEDELKRTDRKRKAIHHERREVMSSLMGWLKYWVVFAAVEWLQLFAGHQVGLAGWVPFWNFFRFVLILNLQLPVPWGARYVYDVMVLPLRAMDISEEPAPGDGEAGDVGELGEDGGQDEMKGMENAN